MTTDNSIKKAIYDMCIQANTRLPEYVFDKLLFEYEKTKDKQIALILKNAQMACEKNMPLCQDTGQVLVFVKGSAKLLPDNLNDLINEAVKKAYEDNFYRKSVVGNAFTRINTQTNTPVIIYTEIVPNDFIEINLMIKGAGSENISSIEMLSPTANEEDVKNVIIENIKKMGEKGCPPYFVGVGTGGTMDYAAVLSKKALMIENNNKSKLESDIINSEKNILDINILSDFTHIACMPVAISINCHSKRYSKCRINKNGKISLDKRICKNFDYIENGSNKLKIHTSEIDKLKNLKIGQEILLSGEIYTARDMAHKRLVEMIKNNESLPIDLKNKIIFYAAPCPKIDGKIENSIGPTTSARMDKYAQILYDNGICAVIGKGERNKDIKGLYLTCQGGIACYLAQCVKSSETVAFDDLTPEAVCKLEIENFPLRVFSI